MVERVIKLDLIKSLIANKRKSWIIIMSTLGVTQSIN